MNHNQFPTSEDQNSDLEASSGITNQERIVDGMGDPEQESGHYYSENDDHDPYEEEDTEDPLTGDVDKFVHPDETRTDEQIAHDEQYAVEPYGEDAADDYWAEHDALYADDGREKVEFTFGTGVTEIAVEDLERDYPGMSHEEVQKQVDADYEKMLDRNKYKY